MSNADETSEKAELIKTEKIEAALKYEFQKYLLLEE
jgi:hypothetical protein